MSTITYTVDLGIAGEIDLVVGFDYQPYERMTHNYPGCPEGYDVFEVKTTSGQDLTWLLANVLNDCGCFAEAVSEHMNPEYEEAA